MRISAESRHAAFAEVSDAVVLCVGFSRNHKRALFLVIVVKLPSAVAAGRLQ